MNITKAAVPLFMILPAFQFNQAAGELIALLDDDQLELIGELLD